MSNFGFIKNKYSVSALILICLLLADIILHKGMSRVIIPKNFTDKISPYKLTACNQQLITKEKEWVKAVNNISIMQKLPLNTPGIECDVYFDTAKKNFFVYHDSSAPSTLDMDSLLSAYYLKKMSADIWLDFKNLRPDNLSASLAEINRLKNKYGLNRQIIVESAEAQSLKQFCDSGYFTSYYIPFFNPYHLKEIEIVAILDSIHKELEQYPASAVSGYYFQYPILKKFFPTYPILTWSDNPTASLISYLFNRQLKNDAMVKVVLFPFKD